MSFRTILGAALCVTFLISGCATIADPVTYSEKKISSPALPVKKVLVIVDASLVADNFGNSVRTKEAVINEMFLPLAKSMVDEVKKTGSEASYLIHFEGARLSPPGDEYSHAWTQTLDRFIKKNGIFVSDFVWVGSILERKGPITFSEIYRTEYRSDGSKCFINSIHFANKAECQKKYMDSVSGQLANAGLRP